MGNNKLKINLVAGIVSFVNAVMLIGIGIYVAYSTVNMTLRVLTDPFSMMNYPFGMSREYTLILGALLLLSLLPLGAGLTLHIIGLVQSKKVGISIVGHILGIIGSAVFWMLPAFVDFAAPGLLIAAGILCLRQKVRKDVQYQGSDVMVNLESVANPDFIANPNPVAHTEVEQARPEVAPPVNNQVEDEI
ncbi:MAG: hypothetical protein FWE25_05920 [Lachnospiraceae bacterium]|nr:hypothetical protein [Lachnospiraceae bacterium]